MQKRERNPGSPAISGRHQSNSESEKDARLGRGLVFDDEIAAQQRMRIQRNFGSGRGSEAAGNFAEAEVWAEQ
ncbi:hypothetical protein MMC31_003984, partial [Peltigera leucophlebia]|nr:hypothetical protein [Peltigera leucophlebia]